MRKSPVRHRVRHHLRQHKPVRDYMRGDGARINPFVRRTVISTGDDEGAIYCSSDGAYKAEHCEKCGPHELRQYRVSFKYEDGSTELVKTNAHSPTEAHEHAEHERSRLNERPTEVIVRNSLGDIVGKLGAGMKKLAVTVKPYAAKLGRASAQAARKAAKLGVKVGKAGVKATGKLGKAAALSAIRSIKDYRQRQRANDLLRDTESRDITKRTRARLALKREFPDVYEEAGLGTPKSIVEMRSVSERDITDKEYVEEARQLAKVHKARGGNPDITITRKGKEKLARLVPRSALAFETQQPKSKEGLSLIRAHSGYIIPRPKPAKPGLLKYRRDPRTKRLILTNV